jgi:polysaccharide biosynthesis/export protein
VVRCFMHRFCRAIARIGGILSLRIAALVFCWVFAAPPALAFGGDGGSNLERAYSDRAGQPLRLYGAHLREGAPLTVRLGDADPPQPALGYVADDYVLGPGDEILLALRGQSSSDRRYRITSDGTLLIEDVPPIAAAGRNLGTVRAEIGTAIAAAHPQTQAFVSLSAIRRARATVLGHVVRPDLYPLPAFASVLDALAAAGGVSAHGGLRDLRLSLPGSQDRSLDLYPFLSGGTDTRTFLPQLPDGALLVIPPLGGTVAVAGDVGTPSIFELPPPGKAAMNVRDALALAGGLARPGQARITLLRLEADGTERAETLPTSSRLPLHDGDLLLVMAQTHERADTITLEGRLSVSGPRPIIPGLGYAAIIREAGLAEDAYRPMAVLSRFTDEGAAPHARTPGRSPRASARNLQAIDLIAWLEGRSDAIPQAGDRLIVFSQAEIDFLRSRMTIDTLRGLPLAGEARVCPALATLAAALNLDGERAEGSQPAALLNGGGLASSAMVRAALAMPGLERPCPPLFQRDPDLLPFLLRQSVFLRRGSGRIGFYPIAQGASPAILGQGDRLAAQGPLRPGAILDAIGPGLSLIGAFQRPGGRPFTLGDSLASVIGGPQAIAADAYGLAAILEGQDPVSLAPRRRIFSPAAVLAGTFDLPLRDGDSIRLFSRHDVLTAFCDENCQDSEPSSTTERQVELPTLINAHLDAARADPFHREPGEGKGRSPREETGLSLEDRNLLADRLISVRGGVRHPGLYPVAGPVSLDLAVRTAGGARRDALRRHVEILSALRPAWEEESDGDASLDAFSAPPHAAPRIVSLDEAATIMIQPGDSARIGLTDPAPFSRSVWLIGEAVMPGRYDFAPGERLSSLLRRAGGLSPQAYPPGVIFTRQSARQAEAEGLRRAALELDRTLAQQLASKNPPDPNRVALIRQIADDARRVKPLGRITIAADPAFLAQVPEQDILLEPGDRIYIPQRPLTVTVVGETLSPASLQYRPDKRAIDYLREAGGLTRFADKDRIFMIRPDGSATPLGGRLRDPDLIIEPGATLVAPRDAEPFELLPLAQSVTTILSQLAFTAAAIASLEP